MTNPIIDELHVVRKQMLADAGGTLAGLVAKIQADQARSDRPILKTTNNKAMQTELGLQDFTSGTPIDPAR